MNGYALDWGPVILQEIRITSFGARCRTAIELFAQLGP
jgi:hypothetical protein